MSVKNEWLKDEKESSEMTGIRTSQVTGDFLTENLQSLASALDSGKSVFISNRSTVGGDLTGDIALIDEVSRGSDVDNLLSVLNKVIKSDDWYHVPLSSPYYPLIEAIRMSSLTGNFAIDKLLEHRLKVGGDEGISPEFLDEFSDYTARVTQRTMAISKMLVRTIFSLAVLTLTSDDAMYDALKEGAEYLEKRLDYIRDSGGILKQISDLAEQDKALPFLAQKFCSGMGIDISETVGDEAGSSKDS